MAPVPGSLFTHTVFGVKQSVSAEMRGIYITQKSHNILKDCNQALLYFSTAFQPLNAASKPGNLLATRQLAIIQITGEPLCTSPSCQTDALPSHIKKNVYLILMHISESKDWKHCQCQAASNPPRFLHGLKVLSCHSVRNIKI